MKRSLSYEPEVEHNFWFLLSLVCFLVCVWTICTDVKLPSVCFVLLLLVQQDFLTMYAGGGSRVQSLPPTKTLWFPW